MVLYLPGWSIFKPRAEANTCNQNILFQESACGDRPLFYHYHCLEDGDELQKFCTKNSYSFTTMPRHLLNIIKLSFSFTYKSWALLIRSKRRLLVLLSVPLSLLHFINNQKCLWRTWPSPGFCAGIFLVVNGFPAVPVADLSDALLYMSHRPTTITADCCGYELQMRGEPDYSDHMVRLQPWHMARPGLRDLRLFLEGLQSAHQARKMAAQWLPQCCDHSTRWLP